MANIFADGEELLTKSDISSLQSAVAGKVKTVNNVAPDDKGNITIPAPDLSGLETKADAKKALDAKADKTDLDSKADASSLQALDGRVTALENKPGDIIAVTQAQYDQLVKDSKVQQNVIYAVSHS